MLTELQKSPTSFDSFEKGVSFLSRPNSRRQPGTLETSYLFFPNRLSTSGHTLRSPRMARLTTRKSGRTETTQKTSDSLKAFVFTTRSTEFVSKKEGNAHNLRISSEHQVIETLPRQDYILVPSSSQHASSTYRGPRADARRSTKKITSRFQWWLRERGLSQLLLMKATGRLLQDQRQTQIQWW